MEQTLFTFRKYDYLDMKRELQELFEHTMYLDSCSVGKTTFFQNELNAMFRNIEKIRSILNVKYLFPADF